LHRKNQVILVVDAFNQFVDSHQNKHVHRLEWLPKKTPKNISIVASTIDTHDSCKVYFFLWYFYLVLISFLCCLTLMFLTGTFAESNNTVDISEYSTDEQLKDTLLDFFLMSRASEILAFTTYSHTGFSEECSRLFSIPYSSTVVEDKEETQRRIEMEQKWRQQMGMY
jgi:hypothetical protein